MPRESPASRGRDWPGGLEQQVEVVPHDDEGGQLPAATHDRALKVGEQALPIVAVPDDELPGIAACHHMIDGALEFDPQASWHSGTLATNS